MNNINLQKITEDFIDTFLEAGKIAKKISEKGVKITIKPDKSPVTDGDLAVDKILRSKIKKLTPNIPPPIIATFACFFIISCNEEFYQ